MTNQSARNTEVTHTRGKPLTVIGELSLVVLLAMGVWKSPPTTESTGVVTITLTVLLSLTLLSRLVGINSPSIGIFVVISSMYVVGENLLTSSDRGILHILVLLLQGLVALAWILADHRRKRNRDVDTTLYLALFVIAVWGGISTCVVAGRGFADTGANIYSIAKLALFVAFAGGVCSLTENSRIQPRLALYSIASLTMVNIELQ